MASIGENGFPYIQHHGGTKGFVKVLETNTLAFIGFSGNKQYISVGNVTTNRNVSVIMVDYPSRSRLKIYAKAKVVELKDRPDLVKELSLEDYVYKPERMILLAIEAYDWNCPQHITPRYTTDEIEEALLPQREYIKKLEQEIEILKSK
jgi:predicted pyridoxine 5'-phosphate oxidase superfamily flavin-nucleotide-binding protein